LNWFCILIFFVKSCVTARPNMLYIVRLGPYRPHGLVPGDVSSLLSLTSQNAYNMLATNTTNKASYQTLTRLCKILSLWQFFLLYPQENVSGNSVESFRVLVFHLINYFSSNIRIVCGLKLSFVIIVWNTILLTATIYTC
jgi:hypothetical protein